MNTTAGFLSCDDRCVPVRVSYGCGGEYGHFNPSHEQQKRCYVCTIDKVNIMIAWMASGFTNDYPQRWIQIPIVLLPALTALHEPAVSSIEACLTPAR